MSYTPIGWQTGDTITAEKLNKMDNGWSVETATQTLCNDTITSVDDGGMYCAQLSASSITADTIVVTFDGSTYQCAKDGDGGYGDSVDFTFATYPFRIESDGFIITETGGSHIVKVETVETTYDASTAFTGVVNSIGPVFRAYANVTTWQEVHDAVKAGKIVYIIKDTEIDDNELKVQIVTRVFIDENTGNYYVEAIAQPNGSSASIVGYVATTANGPILPN